MKSRLFLFRKSLLLAGALLALPMSVWAWESPNDTTDKTPNNWYHLDKGEDQWVGVSTEKAYRELLAGRTSLPVVVAVLDGGVEVEHEDLNDNIWVNEDEIPGNGIDDDNNGYIDDVHGWNFLGGKDGKNVDGAPLELTRLYRQLKGKYDAASPENLSKKEAAEYALYKDLKEKYDQKKSESEQTFAVLTQYLQIYQFAYPYLEHKLGDKPVSAENVRALEIDNDTLRAVKDFMLFALENEWDEAFLQEGYDYYKSQLDNSLNLELFPRQIVGDDPNNLKEKYYGNNDVTGPDADHGTHVAGIIGAARNNGLGMDGIADNVRIMAVRVVPDGDEYDKDVANAIRYAVDNGARVINMSFGKDYSPHKKIVDKAVKYARKKGVLLVHAAGNDNENIDEVDNFPTANLKSSHSGKRVDNWIEVGASSWENNEELAAEFSNYGDRFVDIFAPGVEIYSTTIGNSYERNQGTSMAAPVVSGIAALLYAYYPDLDYKAVKDIILSSAVRFEDLKVKQPGSEALVNFGSLSATGGVVNAYEALKLAESRYGK